MNGVLSDFKGGSTSWQGLAAPPCLHLSPQQSLPLTVPEGKWEFLQQKDDCNRSEIKMPFRWSKEGPVMRRQGGQTGNK